MDELNEDERAMVGLVRDFVDRGGRPVARALERVGRKDDALDALTPAIADALLAAGLSGEDVARIMGGNVLQLLCQALP